MTALSGILLLKQNCFLKMLCFLSLFSVSFTHFSALETTHTGHTSGLILTHEILTSVELHGCKLDWNLAGESL